MVGNESRRSVSRSIGRAFGKQFKRGEWEDGSHRTNPAGKIAFVLSGGAARGAMQVGMLRVLLSRGVIPDLIVGTSVGAFNGAWLASDPTSEGVQQLVDIWTHVRQEDIFAGGTVSVLLHLLRQLPSLYGGEAIHAFLRRMVALGGLESSTFESLSVSLAVVATNLTRGRAAIFDHGHLMPALLATSAIPALLPPITINGEQYVDGGLLDNVGLRVAIERGATRIYVLDTSCDGPAEQPATSLAAVISRSVDVVSAFHLQSALERYADCAQVVVFRDDGRVACRGADFSAIESMIVAGQAIAEEALAAPQLDAPRGAESKGVVSQPVLVRAGQAFITSGSANKRRLPMPPDWQRFTAIIHGVVSTVAAWVARGLPRCVPPMRSASFEPPTPMRPPAEPQRAAS